MLTEVKAYSSWPSAPTLPLSDTGRAETDLIQIRNIDGLEPVKASVNTSPYGAVDGSAYVGGNVLSRNIVLTIHPNPDWNLWNFTSLRRLLYLYFMPKRPIQLVFYSDDMVPVTIDGIVEDVSPNLFSEDPEFLVSIICPDPYFTALYPIVLTGQSIRSDGVETDIVYNGNVDTGIILKVTHVTDPTPTSIEIKMGDALSSNFTVDASVGSSQYFMMSSLPRQKFVQNINFIDGVITNLLSKVISGSSWPILQPGDNKLSVITDDGVQDWELTYYEKYGGL